jgi:4-hydroxybenzoate polyprenyltransferase
VAFSLLASAVYVVNDLKDVDVDRLHPRKRHRPIASGALSPAVAWSVVPVLLVIVAALCSWLGFGFMLVLAAYLASNVAYSFGLKNQVILDVFVIASGFVLRAVAGVELLKPVAPETQLSSWLLVCTFFGALFLAVSKRRRELINAGHLASDQRAVLATYTPELLDRMLTIAAACTLMSYALYTIWPATVAKFGSEAMMVTVPVVAYGVFRYLHLVRVSESSEDPSLVLLADRPIQATVLVYVAMTVWILYIAR